MPTMLWAVFILLVLFLLALDLGVFHRKSHVIGTKEALLWTAFWVALALLFNVGIYFLYDYRYNQFLANHPGADITIAAPEGLPHPESAHAESAPGIKPLTGHDAALLFLTGFIVEKSLSMDNIFVMAVIFSYYQIPAIYQHRVLFWGIVGALVFRGVMIAAGVALIHNFWWINYVFGSFLVYTAYKMMTAGEEETDLSKNPVLRLIRRFFPITSKFHGDRFFVHSRELNSPEEVEAATGSKATKAGTWVMTPLFLALMVVETTDVMFAVDSIPAIFAITSDPFLVFTSNVFAILGLRALYFALASLLPSFRFLKVSLVILLALVGLKMLLHHHLHVPSPVSLGAIVVVLGSGVIASLLWPGPTAKEEPDDADADDPEAAEEVPETAPDAAR